MEAFGYGEGDKMRRRVAAAASAAYDWPEPADRESAALDEMEWAPPPSPPADAGRPAATAHDLPIPPPKRRRSRAAALRRLAVLAVLGLGLVVVALRFLRASSELLFGPSREDRATPAFRRPGGGLRDQHRFAATPAPVGMAQRPPTGQPHSAAAHDDAAALSGDAAEYQRLVRDGFLHAWKGYETYAWGLDTLHPVTKEGSDDFLGMAISIIDSMDTALLMGEKDIFEKQYQWVVDNLHFESQDNINVFETTIRILGGLLSAYALSDRKPLLDLAEDLGRKLLPAFATKTGLPFGTIGLADKRTYNPSWVQGGSSVAEAGTLTLEFRYLSHATGDPVFKDAVDRIAHFFHDSMHDPTVSLEGLFPMFIHPDTGKPTSTKMITFGARGDSLYEYFIKAFVQTGGSEQWLLDMYDQSMSAMTKYLVRETKGPKRLTYVAELNMNHPNNPIGKMDHLVCFVPGMLALGAHNGAGALAQHHPELNHLALAKRIMRTCYEMYAAMPTGLAPEIVALDESGEDLVAKGGAKHHLIRPEAVESLFILWRITKDPIYREWGWKIFEKIDQYTRVPSGGFSGLKDVTVVPPELNNKMDSFFLAETLKYLYLLFSPDDVVPLDQFVFNTEAHPLPIWHSDSSQGI